MFNVEPDETFSRAEAALVIHEYVCGVCHDELTILASETHYRVHVICTEHGDVTKCGRVMRASVDIEMERSHSKFKTAIRNLPDLWGELIEKRLPPREGETRTQQNLRELGF